MYTLRIITPLGIEINHHLGNRYNVMLKSKAPSQFELEKFNHVNEWKICVDNPEEKCYGFVFTDEYKSIAILSGWQVFVMTESGKTFSNLTLK